MIAKLLPIVVALVAIYAAVNYWPQEQKVKRHANPIGESHIDLKEANRINQAMKAIEEMGGFPKYAANCSKIAIGYNVNSDVTMTLDSLKIFSGFKESLTNLKDHATIHNMDEFYETFGYFMQQGAAAERHVEPEFFAKLSKEILDHPRRYTFVGGNAALMNNALLRDNPCLQTLLGGYAGKYANQFTRATYKIVPEQDPATAQEEYHFIFEYGVNETWGNIKAPRANRLIIQSDRLNAELRAMDAFHEETLKFNPYLVVLAGVHLMENEPEEFKKASFAKINTFLKALKPKTLVHFELASTASKDYPKRLFDEIITNSDSLGLNEQELGSLYRALGGSQFDDFNTNISPRTVLEVMKFIFGKANHEGRKLNRIHFHTLHFQIIGHRENAKEWGKKENQLVGVTSAVMLSVREACNAFAFTPDLLLYKAPELIPALKENNATKFWEVPPQNPIAWIKEEGFRFAYSGSLICKTPYKTVGLGDIISATALLYQLQL